MSETIIISRQIGTVYVKVNSVVSTVVPRTAAVIYATRQGQKGVDGVDNKFISYVAGVVLSGNRCVCVNDAGLLIYADSGTLAHAHRVLGITTGAISSGATGSVQVFGEMTEAGWSWSIGSPVYLGINGALTQTAPATGFALAIGFAVTATKIYIDIKQPIILT